MDRISEVNVNINITIPFIDDVLDHSVIYEENKGDFERARYIAEEKLADARQQGSFDYLGDALIARGIVHMLQGEMPAAIQRFEELDPNLPEDYNRRLRDCSKVGKEWLNG